MSCSDVLLNLATAARLLHTNDGTGFADLTIDGHRETWPLRSWDAPSPALNALEAEAQFDGPQRPVSVRVAEQDGLIYLDLADEFWRCIEIGANGWRPLEAPAGADRRQRGAVAGNGGPRSSEGAPGGRADAAASSS